MLLHWSSLLLIPGIILTFWAQSKVKDLYYKYAQIPSSLTMSGAQVASFILEKIGEKSSVCGSYCFVQCTTIITVLDYRFFVSQSQLICVKR